MEIGCSFIYSAVRLCNHTGILSDGRNLRRRPKADDNVEESLSGRRILEE